jgi:hypothetical protein
MIRAKEVIERSRMNYGSPASNDVVRPRKAQLIEKPVQNDPVKQPVLDVAPVLEVPKDDEPIIDPSKVF